MSIKQPPTNLKKPNHRTLKAGELIERVHGRAYAGDAFNPGKGGPTRFAPIKDINQKTVATLYAAATLDAAIFETIFHDVPAKAKKKRVSKTQITSRAHSQLELTRDLKLASLRGPDLKKWGITRNDLIASSPKLYKQTAAWAAAIHHQFSDIEGLVWTSNQCDPAFAYMFFGDRVSASDFNTVSTRDGKTDKGFFKDVRSAGKIASIKISV